MLDSAAPAALQVQMPLTPGHIPRQAVTLIVAVRRLEFYQNTVLHQLFQMAVDRRYIHRNLPLLHIVASIRRTEASLLLQIQEERSCLPAPADPL